MLTILLMIIKSPGSSIDFEDVKGFYMGLSNGGRKELSKCGTL
jgi:hypothetical protein